VGCYLSPRYELQDFAARASLTPSLTLAIDSKAKQMKAEARTWWALARGSRISIRRSISRTPREGAGGWIHKIYSRSGIPELRQAIADKHKREMDWHTSHRRSSFLVGESIPATT